MRRHHVGYGTNVNVYHYMLGNLYLLERTEGSMRYMQTICMGTVETYSMQITSAMSLYHSVMVEFLAWGTLHVQ